MFANYGPYYTLAQSHGLTVTPPGGPGLFTTEIHATGWIGGRAVHVTRYLGKNPTAIFRAGLQPSLDLGLGIAPSSALTWIAQLVRGPEIEVGDDAFDAAFAIRGDEPERVKAFLTPQLRATLMQARDSPLAIDDHGVTLRYGVGMWGIDDGAEMLDRSIRAMVALAAALDAGRVAAPPPADVAPLVARLADFAKERHLACAFDSPPRLTGRLGELPVWIVARRRKKNATDLEITIRFDEPLGAAFSIATARTGMESWFSQDVEVGDVAFDRAFDVRAEEPARIVALLDESTRQTLLELGRGRRLRLDAGGLFLGDDARDFDPIGLPALVERAADLLKTMARTTRIAAGAAYR